MTRVLVLSPHPDDEAIGCGGTICRHVAGGDEVRVIFLTSGEAGGHGASAAETAVVREREAAEAAEILGVKRIEFWRAPDGKLRAGAALVSRLEAYLREYSPDFVYTTHSEEAHSDHKGAPRLLRAALDKVGTWPQVRLFEIWTPLHQLDHIEDISPFMETKLRAVRAYASQCAVLSFDDAVTGLNRYRGEMHSWPGGDYAEVFMAMRP
jgi:LmbE family N-acetylglucosaminyl deacetylase